MTSGFGTCFDSMGGQVMDTATWKSPINSPQGVKAASWGKLMSKYAPEGVSSYTWYEAMQAFMKGSVAMFVDADHMAGSFEDPKESSVVGKVGYAVPPQEMDIRQRRISGYSPLPWRQTPKIDRRLAFLSDGLAPKTCWFAQLCKTTLTRAASLWPMIPKCSTI